MENRVSVILPIYNVEKYLSQCIESILCQSYQNFEIILVDDGSPDGCGKICDEYAQKDSRITVIHKKNGGASSARNAGLECMSREGSVLFIDPDDYIHPQMLETLVNLMDEYSADISLCFSRGTHVRDYSEPDADSYDIKVLTGKQAIVKMFDGTSFDFFGYNPTSIIFRLYKKELFRDNLRFNENAKMAEDLTLSPYLLDRAEKVVSTNRRMYYVYHADNSLTRSEMSSERFTDLCNTVMDMYEERLKYFKSQKDCDEIVNLTYTTALFDIIDKIVNTKNNKTLSKKMKKFYRKLYKEAVSENRLDFKKKIILKLYGISPVFYKILTKIS